MNTQDKLPTRYDSGISRIDKEMAKIYAGRYIEYRKDYALAGKFAYEPKFPLYIMLEQTYKCNLSCPSCIHSNPEAKKRFNVGPVPMPWKIFKKIILEAQKYSCPSIVFNVNDEPLLVKDLPERVAFAREHGFMDLFITTNGNLLTKNKIKALVNAGITRVLFSIDAASEATYRKVRPGGVYGDVMRNLFSLLEYKKRHKLILPAVRVSFVPTRVNYAERGAFTSKFSKLVDYVEIQPFTTYYGQNVDLIPAQASHVKGFRCVEPWRKLIVRANGDVLPCCSFYGYELVLGNVRKDTLASIFNGRACSSLRKDCKNGKYRLKPCKACSESFYTSQRPK